jgi:hypothetical protein
MPKITFQAEILSIDLAAWTKSLTEAAEVQLRQGAREFLRAAIPRVPIDTGMAVGSFLNIGRFLRVAVPRGPGPYRRSRPNEGPQTYKDPSGNEGLKTPDFGAELSTDPEDAFTRRNNIIAFTFRSNVYHYQLNEFGFFGPWGSFDAGSEAMEQYMLNVAVNKLPRITSFIVKRNKVR